MPDRKIKINELFKRLNGFEFELFKYIKTRQGETAAPVDLEETAKALKVGKDDVRRLYKRLVTQEVLTADGENFKINPDLFEDGD